jgi:AraC-like DNA-binding protein
MLVSPVHLRVLAVILDMEGHDSKKILRAAGVADLENLADTDWVSVEVFERVILDAIDQTGDAGFGLTAAHNIGVTRYGVMAMLVMNMPTLRQGLNDIIRYAPILLERPEITYEERRDGSVVLRIDPVIEQGDAAMYRREFITAGLMHMLRYAGATNGDLLEISFQHAAPAHAARYREAFGVEPCFGRPETAITFSWTLMDRPAPTHDRITYLELQTKAERSLSASQMRQNIVQRVKEVLLSTFPEAPGMPELSRQLGMSERSLRRQLADHDTSHTALVRECRHLMAERLLADSGLSLKRVADELGFSSVTCFHRAFKVWTGHTPQAWRRMGPRRASGRGIHAPLNTGDAREG